MLTVEGTTVRAETRTLSATFEGGTLTRLVGKLGGRELIRVRTPFESPLQLVYANGGATDVLRGPDATVSVHALSPTRAEVRLHGWDADGVIAISEDVESGDLIV